MIKYTFISAIISISCIAQNSKDGILKYHKDINNAELLIIGNNAKKALQLYHTAFSIENISPFAKDYYNAAICAAMLNKKN